MILEIKPKLVGLGKWIEVTLGKLVDVVGPESSKSCHIEGLTGRETFSLRERGESGKG